MDDRDDENEVDEFGGIQEPGFGKKAKGGKGEIPEVLELHDFDEDDAEPEIEEPVEEGEEDPTGDTSLEKAAEEEEEEDALYDKMDDEDEL